jgi:hypothetical protein
MLKKRLEGTFDMLLESGCELSGLTYLLDEGGFTDPAIPGDHDQLVHIVSVYIQHRDGGFGMVMPAVLCLQTIMPASPILCKGEGLTEFAN